MELVYALLLWLVLFSIASSLWLISKINGVPSTIIMQSLLNRMVMWRRDEGSVHNNFKFQWSSIHLSIVHDYFTSFYRSCHFADLRYAGLFDVVFMYDGPGSWRFRAKIAAYVIQELQQIFRVPRLKAYVKEEYCIKKHQLIQVFLSFLVELLYRKTESFVPYMNQIGSLENELRFLRTILGDKSLKLCDDEQMMGEFEAVTNEAGSFIHSLLFSSTDTSVDKKYMDLQSVLNHLQENIGRFRSLLPSIGEPGLTLGSSMVGSLILNSLIPDLEDLINRQDNRIADVKNQIQILHQGLTVLQSSIKDARQPSETGEFNSLLKRIGNMAHHSEYLIVSFLSGDAPRWYLINRLAHINRMVELIATELQDITQKHEVGAVKAATRFKTLLGEGNIGVTDVIVDFDDRRETDVLEYLIGRGNSLRLISISGMLGIGKTTLAKKLFNHPSVNTWFDIKSWCVVSQNYDRQNILLSILVHINGDVGKDSATKMDSESLVVQIYKTLYSRRYLIIIDDVWGLHLWQDLMSCFPDNGNGSRILFTTRNKVACPSNCDNYAVPSLSNEECWELLEKKVFGNVDTCPPRLIRTGKKIAANCWGLPIAVIVIAGILSTMDKEIFLWEEVERNLSLYICDGGDKSLMQILRLSYKHLAERLKVCFLYFRAFSEQKEIEAGELMRLWISEGFIHKEEGKSAEDVAEECLMELIDKNLVMVAKRRWDGGVKTCVLHDLLRDFCSKICNEKGFLVLVKNSIQALFENGLYGIKSDCYIAWSYCRQVRSLPEVYDQSPFHLSSRMRLLRVLHSCFISDYLSTGVEYLVNLRYLVISDLPASIGSLVNLEYLRVEIQEVVYLPPAILKMMKLRYLNIDRARYGVYFQSFRENKLEFLSNIIITKVNDEEMLKCSPNLRKLKCEYTCEPLISNFDLSFLSRLESVKILLHGSRVMQMSFPSSIRKLSIHGWEYLTWEMMSTIGRLEKLEVLKLSEVAFEGNRWDTREGEFEKLKYLKLDQVEDLSEWNVELSSHFPVLQRLVLIHCGNLVEIPGEIGEITTLQLIEIKGRCTESMVESAKMVQQQQSDFENEELRVIIC